MSKSKTKEEFLSEATARFRRCDMQMKRLREDWLSNVKFALGEDQWTQADKTERSTNRRPMLTINLHPAAYNQVINDFRQNRPSFKVRPVDSVDDPDKADIVNGIMRRTQTLGDYKTAVDEAFFYSVIGGFGFVRIKTDYCDDESHDQDIFVDRVKNPCSVYFPVMDCEAFDWSDAEYCFATTDVTREAFERLYPNRDFVDFGENGVGDPADSEGDGTDSVKILEYFWVEQDKVNSYLLDDGQILKTKENYEIGNEMGLPINYKKKAFTEEEKQVLDQFIMNGGKTLWLVDAVSADMDSLYNETGTILAAQRELNLTDMFFKYGIRINPLLVKDEYATPIKLATGNQGSETQMQEYSWKFSPFVYPTSTNPIVKNMEGIKFEFASPIEILKNDIKKTVLLSSSEYSKTVGTPSPISLDMVTEETTPEEYEGKGLLPVAVLMEGKFKSMYQNRVLPFKDNSFQATGKDNKMIVISDGDVVKNQMDKGVPLELGFDKWTNQLYGNKEFLMNCVNYLLDDNGLINIRSKDVDLPLLNKGEVYKNYTTAQLITVGLPIVILAIFGFLFTFLRKRKYSR